MRYIKGSQETVLKDLPIIKVKMVDPQGEVESIWAREGKCEIYLGNHSVSFSCPTWGVAFPYSGEDILLPEVFPEVLTLHPDAWEEYLKNGIIDKEGNLLQS
jgi:hypothetical protein